MEEIIPKRIRRKKIIAAVFKAVIANKISKSAVVRRAQELKHRALIRAYGLRDKFQQVGGIRVNRQKFFHVVELNGFITFDYKIRGVALNTFPQLKGNFCPFIFQIRFNHQSLRHQLKSRTLCQSNMGNFETRLDNFSLDRIRNKLISVAVSDEEKIKTQLGGVLRNFLQARYVVEVVTKILGELVPNEKDGVEIIFLAHVSKPINNVLHRHRPIIRFFFCHIGNIFKQIKTFLPFKRLQIRNDFFGRRIR